MSQEASKNKMKNRRLKKLLGYVFLGIFVFILTSSLEYITDDWHFRFIFTGFMPGENETRVRNARDVLTSMQAYYQQSGGRVLAHGLVYFILFFPKMVYNVLNAVMFVTMTYLTEKLSFSKKFSKKFSEEETKLSQLIVLIVLLFLFLPSFGDTCLWTSGSVNYLWMSLFPLFFLICHEKGWWGISLLFALISGFTNETTGGVLAVYLITQGLLKTWNLRKAGNLSENFLKKDEDDLADGLRKKDEISRKSDGRKIIRVAWLKVICQIASMLPGMLFILKAPGNINRAHTVNQTKVFSLQVTLAMLGKTALWIFQNYYFVMILVILVMPIYFRKEIRRFLPAIPFFMASLAGMAALALSGTFLKRAHFLNCLLLVISFLIVVEATAECIRIHGEELKEKFIKVMPLEKGRRYLTAVKVMGCVLLTAYFLFQFKCFFDTANQDRKRMKQIEQCVERGEDSITIPMKVHFTAGAYYPKESSVSGLYEALWMGLYYGIEISIML